MENPVKIHDVKVVKVYNDEAEDKKLEEVTESVEIRMIEPSGKIDTLYSIVKDPGKNWERFYKVVIYPNEPKHRYQTTMVISETYFPGFIKDLKYYFKRGRIVTAISDGLTCRPAKGAMAKRISYTATVRLLRFENRASRFVTKAPNPIRYIKPTKIIDYLDRDDYAIEVWGRRSYNERRLYTYITFDEQTKLWLNEITS